MTDHVVVCLGGLSVHANGSPIFGCKVYGPFEAEDVEERMREIRAIEGGAVLARPLVDLIGAVTALDRRTGRSIWQVRTAGKGESYRRMSAD